MAGINLTGGVSQQKNQNPVVHIASAETAAVCEKHENKGGADENKDATVQISEEARQKYLELEMLKQNAESLREGRKAGEEYTDDMIKVMEIFRRIARGDKVPPTDEKKLMEYSSDLYQAAKSAAMLAQNKERKKYKALFEEDEETNKVSQNADGQDMLSKEENADNMGISFENVVVAVSK